MCKCSSYRTNKTQTYTIKEATKKTTDNIQPACICHLLTFFTEQRNIFHIKFNLSL